MKPCLRLALCTGLLACSPLFAAIDQAAVEAPLQQMTTTERLHSDFTGTGLTVGRDPMAYHREEMNRRKVRTAAELLTLRDGMVVKVAGAVIVRQRPGTAHGFLFISLEDETGISNIIVSPDLFERERASVTQYTFIVVTGILQNQQGSIHVKAAHIEPFRVTEIPVPVADYQMPVPSHDFH